MLDEQFFGNDQLQTFFNEHFILLHAYHSDACPENITPRDDLYDTFELRSWPTVLIANADGIEIDRMIGYDPPPEEYQKALVELYTSDNTLISLVEAHQSNPQDVVAAANLARKYQLQRRFEKMAEVGQTILEQKDKAKSATVSLGDDGEVSVYEFARLTEAYYGPDKLMGFLDEFPQSSLQGTAFYYLGRFLRDPEHKDAAQEAYAQLFTKYPHNSSLVMPYISHCARNDWNIEQAVKLAEGIAPDMDANDERFASTYARLLLKQGDADKAWEVYGDSFVDHFTEEKDAGGLNGFAWFWALEGKYLDKAKWAAEKSLEFFDDPNTWDTLSMVYWKMGMHDKAIEVEEKALEMSGGQNKYYQERIADIKADMAKDK